MIAAADPQWVYLRTGRRAVLPPFELDGKKGQQLIDSVPVRYLIASVKPGGYERFTAPLLAANPDAWRRVWSGANGRSTWNHELDDALNEQHRHLRADNDGARGCGLENDRVPHTAVVGEFGRS